MTVTPIQPARLADAACVMLDPAVEILDVEIDECALLCHTERSVGMAIPPGDGLLDFVRSLMGKPVRVGTLRRENDDQKLIDEMLSSLVRHGFVRVTPHEDPPATAAMRPAVVFDLDAAASTDALHACGDGREAAPEVLLLCRRLDDHGATLRELAQRRGSRLFRAHNVVIRVFDVHCDRDTRTAILRLGAAVEVDGIAWPAPHHPVAGLADLVRALVPTHVVMRPDRSILDEAVRTRCVAWCRREFVSGLCLRLEPAAIAADDIDGVLNAIGALESELGDVVVTNLPGDEVLLGNADRGWLGVAASDAERRLRRAYLRRRIPQIKAQEGDCPWSQVPALEDKWVRSAEDLLPNHPDLLLLGPGSSVVDLCGGMGRVARRLAPAVGPDGVIISIEVRRFLVERARRFAHEGGYTNLQFRPGRAERLPLPDCSVDAAVNEWTGAIWELGLGPTMVGEMVRVVRPGGRIAVTHRLVQLRLDSLDEPWVQYPQIYRWVRDAFRHPELSVIAERVWGQTVPSLGGENASLWVEQYMPRLVNPNDRIFPREEPEGIPTHADVYLTMIAERRSA